MLLEDVIQGLLLCGMLHVKYVEFGGGIIVHSLLTLVLVSKYLKWADCETTCIS